MRYARVFLTLIFTLAFTTWIASAAEDTFTVRTLVGSDTTPPSVPLNLSALPVATSQIDLTWGTSTDDFQLAGYQVFRDDVQVATTTVTNYSDVGLTPSTTYAYYVTAFDSFDNFSASSTAVATTTLALTPTTTPPVEEETSGGGARIELTTLPLELVSLEVIPSQYGAVIRYTTRGYVRSVIQWGKTISYELGSSAERAFSTSHQSSITELKPSTTYHLTIQGENHMGVFGVLTETSFTTLPADDIVPPGNVMNFTAVQQGNDVELSWDNPRDADFDRVRILKSDRFYPNDTADGWVVYEGIGAAVDDSDALSSGTRIFYTAFTYDKEGNISSGAIVSIAPDGSDLPIDETLNDTKLEFSDVEFFQDDEKIQPSRTGSVLINGGWHLTIAIPYDRFPEHLKSILVTIVPETDTSKTLSFLLRANKDKSWYTARLAPLGVAGNFSVTITVFDFKTAQIGYTKGSFTSVISTYERDEVGFGTVGSFDRDIFIHASYLVLFTLLLLSLAILARRLMYSRW